MRTSTKVWEKVRPYVFIAPAMLFLMIFTVYPLVNMVQLSFTNSLLPKADFKYVGFYQYDYLFQRKDFWNALSNTWYYSVFTVVGQFCSAMLFAVWLKKNTKLNSLVRTALFTPHIVALLSVAMVWSWIMNEDTGLLNAVLQVFGIEPLRWLNSSATAMPSLIIVSWWKSVGYYTVILFAALQGIPQEIYEAAEMDDAGKISCFFKITFPMVSPQAFLCLITMTIGSFKVFETIRVMTGGGPGKATYVLVYYIYTTAFTTGFNVGLASAAGVVLLAIVGVLTALYFVFLSKKVHYQ